MRVAEVLQGRLGINWTASKGQRNRTSLKTNIGWSETLREIIDEALAIKRNIDAPNEIVFGNLAGQRYTKGGPEEDSLVPDGRLLEGRKGRGKAVHAIQPDGLPPCRRDREAGQQGQRRHGRHAAYQRAHHAAPLRPKDYPCCQTREMNHARSNSKFGIRNAHVLVGALADNRIVLAEWTGLEPATPGVTGRYSNQLNYHSMRLPRRCASATNLASPRGFEPL